MRPSLLLACLLALPLVAQEAPRAPEPPAYPPERPRAHVFFFVLEGKLDAAPMRKALSELSTRDTPCRLVCGPRKTGARPSGQFAAVEAPAALGAKEIAAALRKGCGGAEVLSWTAFQGEGSGTGSDAESQGFFGLPMRDFVLGMSGEIRWYDARAGWRQFYFRAGKLGAKEIEDRYAKLFGPVGGSAVGRVVEEEIRWTLAGPLDPKLAMRVEKGIAKLPGVARCTLDPATRMLSITLRLENLPSCGPAQPFPAELPRDEQAGVENGAVRASFDTLALFELFDREKVGLEPAAAPPGGK